MTAAILADALTQKVHQTEIDKELQALKEQAMVSGTEDSILVNKRQGAADLLGSLRLPHKRDEEWQFTDLSELKAIDFVAAGKVSLDVAAAENFYLPEAHQSRLVFINGFFTPELSNTNDLPSAITCQSWTNLAAHQREQLANYLGQKTDGNEVFSNLNTAGMTDSAVVWIPANTELKSPIHLLFLTVVDPTPIMVQPRLLVVVENNAQVTIAESYGAISTNCTDRPQQQPYFNNDRRTVEL